MDAQLIGRMVLARWLDYSPDRYEKFAAAVMSSPFDLRLANRIEVVPLPFTLIENEPSGEATTGAVARLIPVEAKQGDSPLHFMIAYHHPIWGKEFRVDGRAPTRGDAANPELDWLLRRLRPINTRNRLTQMAVLWIAESQSAFLHSGAWEDLNPLTLTALCGQMNRGSNWPFLLPPGLNTLDVSLLSRAVRGFTVYTPWGDSLGLRQLLPNMQMALRYRLKALLDKETMELDHGRLERAQSDDELRRQVQARWKQNVSRRTIATARQCLGILPAHQRAHRPAYPPPDFDFSPARPLTSAAITTHVPLAPGVYEIALKDACLHYPLRSSAVIYLGRSGNLYKRLRAHLRNHAKFGSRMADGALSFRFAAVSAAHLREAESKLALAFCETYGALPCYNVLMPSAVQRKGKQKQ